MLNANVLDVEPHVLEKIERKHGVTWDEILEACSSPRSRLRRTRSRLFKLYGRTDAGRYLFVILAQHTFDIWFVVTARDMMPNERRQYGRK